ncbi:MAG: hypothetical protein QXS19_07570 [Candidatus Methanomethylicia archaeon]
MVEGDYCRFRIARNYGEIYCKFWCRVMVKCPCQHHLYGWWGRKW